MKGAIEKAQELAAEIPGSFLPGQFDNQANAEAHRRTTGRRSGRIQKERQIFLLRVSEPEGRLPEPGNI